MRCCNNELPSPVYPIVNTEEVTNKPGNTEEIAWVGVYGSLSQKAIFLR